MLDPIQPDEEPKLVGKPWSDKTAKSIQDWMRKARQLFGQPPARHARSHQVGGGDTVPTHAVAPLVVVGTAAARSIGSGPGFMREDAQLVVGAGSPAALGSAAADGVATTVARSDHVHKRAIETTNGGYVRRRLNFGSGFTVADDAGNDEIDVSVAVDLDDAFLFAFLMGA